MRVRLLEQAQAQISASAATVTIVPTVTAKVTGGLLLPAPKTVAFGGTAIIFSGLAPCDGYHGWCYTVTITADGVVRDQRNILLEDSASVVELEDQVRVQLPELVALNSDSVWVGLEGNPPPTWWRGWWLVSAPGNPATGIATGSGDLRRIL
jgi:hypothetical protein